jgi:hypothetical protein
MDDPDLLDFVRGQVRSVWALELLLLMRREAERSWSAEDLVRELRASAPLVETVLGGFVAGGLVSETEPGRFAFAPAAAGLSALVDRLDQLYRERPVSLVNLIVGAQADKIQSFADAFRLKGDKP